MLFVNERIRKRISHEVITEAILDKRSLGYINGLITMAYELSLISKEDKNKYYLDALRKQEVK